MTEPIRQEPSEPTEEPQPPRVIRSEDLFAGDKTLMIEHEGQRYRLMITRNNRLLLVK